MGCDLFTRVYADFTKTNGALSSENFLVFNSNNEMILNGAGRNGTTGSTGTTITLNTCLMVDTYTVKLLIPLDQHGFIHRSLQSNPFSLEYPSSFHNHIL